MGREVRMVPAGWEHPKNAKGEYIRIFGRSFKKTLQEWDEQAIQWGNGLVDDWKGGWKQKGPDVKSDTFEEWYGPRPMEHEHMPDWPESERTHLQMYENTTEGTPISPVCETPEELARWLSDNKASAFGSMTATYEDWLATVNAGFAPGAMISQKTGFISGVEMMGMRKSEK